MKSSSGTVGLSGGVINASRCSVAMRDAINEVVQSPSQLLNSLNACDIFERLDAVATDFYGATSKFAPNDDKSRCDNHNTDRMRHIEVLHIDLVTSAFGDKLEKIRANSGKVSEEECAAVMIDTISNGFDMLKEDQREIMLNDYYQRSSIDGRSTETPHSKRRRDFGI